MAGKVFFAAEGLSSNKQSTNHRQDHRLKEETFISLVGSYFFSIITIITMIKMKLFGLIETLLVNSVTIMKSGCFIKAFIWQSLKILCTSFVISHFFGCLCLFFFKYVRNNAEYKYIKKNLKKKLVSKVVAITMSVSYTCHLTRVGTGSMIWKYDTVHQMSQLRCIYCGQQSHISWMKAWISGHYHRSCESLLSCSAESSFMIRIQGHCGILRKYLKNRQKQFICKEE